MSQGRSRWEPRRWSEGDSDAPGALRDALRDARAMTVEATQVARLAGRLGVGLEAGGVAGAAAVSGVANTLPPTAVVAYKLWAYLSGVVVVSGVALVLGTQLGGGVSDRTIHSEVALVRERASAAAVTSDESRLTPQAGTGLTEPVADVVVTTDPIPSAQQALAGRTGVRRAGRRVSAASIPNRISVPSKLDPEAELTILNGAQDALRQAPHRALTLAEDHAHSFPRGVFAQEREVIAIEALMKLQRSEDAAARGVAFLAAFPTSTHAPRVQQMLGDAHH